MRGATSVIGTEIINMGLQSTLNECEPIKAWMALTLCKLKPP